MVNHGGKLPSERYVIRWESPSEQLFLRTVTVVIFLFHILLTIYFFLTLED